MRWRLVRKIALVVIGAVIVGVRETFSALWIRVLVAAIGFAVIGIGIQWRSSNRPAPDRR